MPRLCWEFHDLCTPWGPIKLEQHGADSFRVTYGKEVKDRLSYGAACAALGQAQMHWLSCESHVDNRTVTERKAGDGFHYVEPHPDSLVFDLWDFIDNTAEDAPDRQDKFFALRERVRARQRA